MRSAVVRGLRRLLLFDLGGQSYAIETVEVREVMFMAALSRPSACPSVLAGFLRVGDRVIPVVDLRRLFELPARPPTLYTPLIVLRDAVQPLALCVDEVLREVGVADADVTPIEGERTLNGCVGFETWLDGRHVHGLDVKKLLLENERRCVDELRALEQRRLDGLDAERGAL